MSLDHLKVNRKIIHPIIAVGFINFVLIMVMLVMSATIFATPSGVELQFLSPGGLAGMGRQTVMTVTSENVIYLNGKVVTLNDLRRFLARGDFRDSSILVKTDRRSSMGRIADILDLCRGIPGATVNVSTVF